jgi:myosin-1
MSRSGCYDVDGLNDSEEFETTVAAMRTVGMGNKQIQAILTLVASVLHLGNVTFRPLQVEAAEGSDVSSTDALSKFCDLVKVDVAVIRHVLTHRELQTMAPGGKIDTYQVPQNPIQASARRDAIAKSIYERLFDMIVNRINVALDPDKALGEGQDGRSAQSDSLSIGVLDIYGFEVFQNNGFEQLCINYVNEKLQQIFIELTLRAEQDEYRSEGIEWTPIPFFNNRVVCELLDAVRPPGIFRVLDDTCKTMHGAREAVAVDKKFIETAAQVHGGHAHFSQSGQTQFTIKHYAGDVVYTAGMFGESNKDALNKDLVAAIKQSEDKLVQYLFPEEIDADDKKAPPTAGTRIRTQCQSLVTALMQCSPHYVRCIKSNDLKKALNVNAERVKHQIKYLGLAENIKVRRAGFAYRAEYHRFLERFNILSKATYPDWRGSDRDGCIQIIRTIEQEKKLPALSSRGEVQYGSSKMFVRKPETYFDLERLREVRLGDFVARIQKAWRYYAHSREFIVMQRSMAKLYAEQRKSRRRDSIYRPFQGDYLDSLSDASGIRDGIFRIIDYYNDQENIVFADASCSQLMFAPKDPQQRWTLKPRIVVLTTAALYVMEIPPPGMLMGTEYENKQLPRVMLRRRVSLRSGDGLESLFLSKSADPCVGLVVSGRGFQPVNGAGDKSYWLVDDKVPCCAITGQKFSLFLRRHHCRVCGNIFCDEVCNYRYSMKLAMYACVEVLHVISLICRAPHPDDGWHFADTSRVCDKCIGLVSVDPLEDLLIVCARRTELVCLIRTQYESCNAKSGKQQGGGPQLPLTFGTSFRMRAGSVPHLSVRPADNVAFADASASVVASASARSPAAARPTASGRQSVARAATATNGGAAYNYGFEVGILSAEYSSGDPASLTSGGSAGQVTLSIGCYPGLPHDLVSSFKAVVIHIMNGSTNRACCPLAIRWKSAGSDRRPDRSAPRPAARPKKNSGGTARPSSWPRERPRDWSG